MPEPESPPVRQVVVDGSNIATEGRTEPSLAQLDEAVRTFAEEHPEAHIVVVVDATFAHRIPAAERAELDEAQLHGELVSPPAGTVGRGDAFVLRIAQRTGATVLSNDSFQEFHEEHPWLFEPGRLIGGKPVPGVGWIFAPRLPVRGPRSGRGARAGRSTKAGRPRLAIPPKISGRTPKIGDTLENLLAAAEAEGLETAELVEGELAADEVADHVLAAEGASGGGSARASAKEASKAAESPKKTAERASKRAAKKAEPAKKAKAAAKKSGSAKRTEAANAAEAAKKKAAKSAKKTKAAAKKTKAAAKKKATGTKAEPGGAKAAEPAKKKKAAKSAKKTAEKAETTAEKATKSSKRASKKADESSGKPPVVEKSVERRQPTPDEVGAAAVESDGTGRRGATFGTTANDALSFITFVAEVPLGSEVEGTVVSFTSHGAMVDVDLSRDHVVHCYVPSSNLADPPPRRARDVLRRGERRTFVVSGLDPTRRAIELRSPGVGGPETAGNETSGNETTGTEVSGTEAGAGDRRRRSRR